MTAVRPALRVLEGASDAVPRCTDAANADAVRDEFGQDFHFVLEWKAWIAWDGKRWSMRGARHALWRAIVRSARDAHASTRAQLVALSEQLRVALLSDKDKAEKIEERLKYHRSLLKWHEQSQNASRIRACAECLEAILPISYELLDKRPMLLNVANGTLDLQSYKLLPHAREHLITQLADVAWDDEAACPTWDAFIERATGGDLQLALFLRRIVGYSLTGLVDDHAIFFHFGALGNNGKSTFLGAVVGMLGDYACAAPRTLLFNTDGPPVHPTELARLYGKRFVVCSEVDENKAFDIAKMKDLTGGDRISARRMSEDFWDLVATHKLHLAGNQEPHAPGDDGGFWRRMKEIPWLVRIPDNEVDRDLPKKLARERSGLLRWAAMGCLDWQKTGIDTPSAVLSATADYRRESDTVGQWLEQHCTLEADARIGCAALRTDYEQWCKELGHLPIGAKRLAKRLRKIDVTPAPVRVGDRVKNGWAGIRLRSGLETFADLPS